jgi:YVTN family beta-propeller protein
MVIGSDDCWPSEVISTRYGRKSWIPNGLRTRGTAPLHRPATVYVANSFSGTVTPILVRGNRPGRPIRVSPGPEQILIGPAGKTVFVAGHRNLPDRGTPATLTAIRTATNVAGKTLRMCRAAPGDQLVMAITPDGSTIYFLCPSANRVIPVRTRTLTAGKPINAGPYPDAIAITPDGRTAYVANGGIRTVTPITTRTNTPGRPIKVGLGPQALAITPDGKTVYAVTPYETTPISTATGKPGRHMKAAGGRAIAITPKGKTAYVVSTPVNEGNRGAVIPIHVATNTVGKPIKVGVLPMQIAVTPDGTKAYVTNFGSGAVTPIRVAANTAGKAIKVGKAPFHLAVTRSGTTVYVVNSIPPFPGTRGSVTPIWVPTGTARKPIRVGRFPLGIAIDP